MIPLNFERSVAARRRAAAIANGTTPGSGSSPASASVREDESTDAASTIDSNGSATKRSTKHRNGLPCLQGFLIRPTSYHHGDARSLYNRPVRVDEYDDADGVGLSAAIAASASSGSGGGVNGGDAVVESGQQPSGAEGRRTSNTRETSEPRLEEGATLGAASAGEVGTAGPDWDSRRRVRSLRLGATDNMYHYRTRPSPGGSGQSSERNATAASEAEGEPVRNGSQHRTRTSTGGNGTLAPPETPTELVRVPSSHRDAARAPAPVPILQNRSSIPTGQASPAPSTRSDGTSGRAGAEPGDEGRSSTRQRPPPPSMQPIRTDTAYLHDPRRDQLPAQNARSDIDMTSGSGMTTAGPSTPIAPPSFTPTAQPQPAPQSRTPLPHTSQQQQQPSTPTVSQPTHQIGHWQTYGPGMAPPPYTEQPVFHYPFGRHRQTDANGPGPSTAGVSGSGAGGSSASRGLTWAREPIGRARNRAGGRSGRNSRASSADRDSGREGEGEEGEEGMTRSASAEGSSTGIDNNVQVATGAEAPETRQQREQSIERKRKKGVLEPLGLPSPFAKASKDRVPDFKSGLREGTIGAWAEVREGLKGPVGLPWYWAKEGGVLGLIGGLSYGITVLALCPISASIVFVNHSSRGAIRSTRTAHQNRQLRKSSSSSATSRARAASTSKLPRTGSIDDSRSLRRRTSILSRTTSRASISPTNERVSMSGDELRRAVSIHGTGVDSDDPETGSGTARGDATDRDETGAGAGSSTLTRATSRGSRWRRSRRAAKAKAKRADPDVPPGPAAAAGAGAGVGDGEVEEGTPTNSTLQSSSGRSAAGASSVGHVAGSTRVGDSPADRRLTELEREAKWGNFDGTNVGPGIGGSASGAHLGPALGERYLSTLERETKLNLFPETHISGPSGRTGSLLDRPTGQGHGVGGEKTVSGSPKRGTHQTSPSISVSMHGDHPGGAANGTGSADGEGTSRLELDTKWPISDSPLGLSPDVQTGTQVSRSRDAPDRYGPVAGSRRPGSGHEGRDGHDGERVTGLEMDTKWQLPSETDTALEQSLSHVRSNSTSDDRALREKMALEGRRAGTEPDRAAVAAYRVAHPRSNGAMEVRRGLPAPPILGLALGSHSEEQQVQDVAREVGGGEEDLPVVQAVDAGVSFQNGAAYTHTPIQSQARPGEQVAGPRSPRTPIPEPAPVQTQTVPQSYTSSARTAPGVTPPPPLMTPTAYEMDIKWPIPDTDLSAPVQSRPLPASRATEHGDVMVARTPEPSPPEPILQTPPAAGRHLPSMPQQQRTQVRTANPPAIPATDGLEGPPERRIGYPPMTKTDTVPSSSTRSRDSDLEAETGTFADTDPEASLDSSLTPSQAKAFSLHMSDNDHAHGHPSPLSVSTSSRAPSTTLSKGITTSGSGESPLSSSSPMTRLSLSPITPFDMERHYRQGFKREGYGFCSGVEMGGEGGRRLSL